MTRIKICGLTRVEDAERCLALGVDAFGLNFWRGSKRRCDVEIARAIVELVGDRARVVAVTVDEPPADLRALLARTGIAWAQLHGDEPDGELRALLPCAYRAVRAQGDAGLRDALAAPGVEVLIDASVPGVPGGTGAQADWALAARVARRRPTWLAGGLRPENVAEAVLRVAPFGVDVASGVESAPGVKDPARLEAFVRAVRGPR